MGTFVIISSPSGGGKNSVIAELIRRIPQTTRFVTTTTRPPRPGETEGRDYYFLDEKTFLEKKKRGDFLETNQYAGYWYGTDRHALETSLQLHHVVFGALDVNGKKQLSAVRFPHLSVFLLPENREVLAERIRRRGGVSESEMEDRLRIAQTEMDQADAFDYQVMNVEGQIEKTVEKILVLLDSAGVL